MAASAACFCCCFRLRFHKCIRILSLSVGTFKCKHLIKLRHRLAKDDNIFCKYSHTFRSAPAFWQLWLLNQTTEQTECIVIVLFEEKFRKQIRLYGTSRVKCKSKTLQHANNFKWKLYRMQKSKTSMHIVYVRISECMQTNADFLLIRTMYFA